MIIIYNDLSISFNNDKTGDKITRYNYITYSNNTFLYVCMKHFCLTIEMKGSLGSQDEKVGKQNIRQV